jgi:hypothetical protein
MNETKELNEIKRCIPLIGKTPDIVEGFMEGDVINLLILLAKYKYNDEFEYTCKCISETEYESFKTSNNYMLKDIKYHKELCKKYKKEHQKSHYKYDGIFDDWHIEILRKYDF